MIRKDTKGFALPVVAICTAVLFIVALGMVQLSANARYMATRTEQEVIARAAADSGVHKALYEMNRSVHLGHWNFADMELSQSRSLPGACADYSYTIEEVSPNSTYRVTSFGHCGRMQKTVIIELRKAGFFDSAIFAAGYVPPKRPKHEQDFYNRARPNKKGGKLVLKNYEIGGYSLDDQISSTDVKIRTNSSHKHAVKLDGDINIKSDVVVGPGAKPEKSVEKKNGAQLEGSVSATAAWVELTPASVPEDFDEVIDKYKYHDGSPITGRVMYSEFELKDKEIQSVAGDCVIYVEKDMKIDHGAKLIVPEGSSLTLYVGEKLEVKKGESGIINEAKDPTKLTIYGTDTCEKVKIETPGEDFYGAIYAPWAKVEIKKAGDIYGAIVGWDVKLEADKAQPGTFYFDESLRGEGTVFFTPTRWDERSSLTAP